MKCLNRFVALSVFALAVLPLGRMVASAPAADEEGFKSIFNGKTLDGWDGDLKVWRVEDGTITGETTKENPAKGNTFLIWRGGKPADFELKVEFRMPNAGFANSGIQIRSWEGPGKWQVSGYQPDMDSGNQYTGVCYGENFRGMLAQRGEKVTIGKDHKKAAEKFADSQELAKAIKKQDWNEYHIIAKGNRITQKINGQLMCELTDEDTVARADGIIALQVHAGPPMKVQFRNIRLKEFSKTQSAPAAKEGAGTPRGKTILRLAVAGATIQPAGAAVLLVSDGQPNKKKIVFIAGGPSHGWASHEHYAGCALLAKCLNESGLPVETAVYKGWPKEPGALDGAAAIVIFSDGGGGHPIMQHLDEVEKLVKKGVGLGCIHYAVEVPKGKAGDLLKDWTGGYFETFWSVNPHWKGEFKQFPKHPVANGVKSFFMDDEWYYHMRFMDNMEGVAPILTTVPPESTRREGNDAHGANEHVRARKGMAEHVCWVRVRPDGGRGFGFTGGHWHWSWGCDSFRKVVLNAIVWIAKIDVPPDGVASKRPTFDELLANQDKKEPPKDMDQERNRVLKLIEEWNKR